MRMPENRKVVRANIVSSCLIATTPPCNQRPTCIAIAATHTTKQVAPHYRRRRTGTSGSRIAAMSRFNSAPNAL